MIFEVVTLFPEMFASVIGASLLGKAIDKGAMEVCFTDPRDFVEPRPGAAPTARRQVDDTPYGGGAGMVMRPEPLVAAIEHAERTRGPAHKVLLTPVGATLTQATVRRWAALDRLLLVCGRYEGHDDRVASFVDEEASIGDFVLTGGELAAMVIIDAVARRTEGVLGNAASVAEESFEEGLLEYPQFTRPAEFRGLQVPEVLTSGNHDRIRRWRRREALIRTRQRRPDLFARLELGDEDRRLLEGEAP